MNRKPFTVYLLIFLFSVLFLFCLIFLKVCQVEQSASVINVTASSLVDTEEQVEVPELRKALRREEAKNA